MIDTTGTYGHEVIEESGAYDKDHPLPSHEHDGYWSGF